MNHKEELRKDFRFKIIRYIYFFIYMFFIVLFWFQVHNYAETNKYEDEDVIIKEMPLWYNVYSKNGILSEVNFFNWHIDNNEVLTYITNNILFNKWKNIEDTKITILQEPTNLNNRTTKNYIEDIYIKKIFKLDINNYIVLFIENIDWQYNYCFVKNTLEFSKEDDRYCLQKSTKKLHFAFSKYKNYYSIWLDDKIYFFNPIIQEIPLIISLDWKVINISKNQNHDLKIISTKWVKIIINTYIDYYLIKRITEKKKVLKIDISKLL